MAQAHYSVALVLPDCCVLPCHQADSPLEDTIGGLLFGYTPTAVRVWMPSPLGQAFPTSAALISTGMSGWGQGSAVSSAPYLSGQLRVMAWRDDQVPDFESPWTRIVSCTSQAYVEIPHGLGEQSKSPRVLFCAGHETKEVRVLACRLGHGSPCLNVSVNELRLGFSNTTRNPEGILSHNNRKS
jgi:hypothetical protein